MARSLICLYFAVIERQFLAFCISEGRNGPGVAHSVVRGFHLRAIRFFKQKNFASRLFSGSLSQTQGPPYCVASVAPSKLDVPEGENPELSNLNLQRLAASMPEEIE